MAAYEAGGGNNDHTVDLSQDSSTKPPPPSPPKPAYTGKPKSRIAERRQPSDSEPTPAPALPTPLAEEDDQEVFYNSEKLKPQPAPRSKTVTALLVLEWLAFFAITVLLILSLTVKTLKSTDIVWSLELWKLCVFVLVVFCGRLFAECLTTTLVFMSERNFLLQTKLLYFIFSMKRSVRVVIWLALILAAWVLLVNEGEEERRRSKRESRVLSKITRGIVSTLVGAVLWMVKTLTVKLVASVFQTKTFFDRIQDLIFNHYILQKLAKSNPKKKEGLEEEVNVEKLWKVKRENVSALNMEGLMNVVTESDSLTVKTEVEQGASMAAVTSEAGAVEAGGRIFKRVAKPHHKFIEEDDMRRYLTKEEVDSAFQEIFDDGAAESRKIEESAFTNWVAKTYNERKCLAITLGDAKTAIEELNRIASCFILILIFVVWILVMDIANTSVLVFISSQLLILVFMFGNSAQILFEAMIFIFVVHPIDVGDRCVIEGEQMVVEEMNILTTIFLKANNEKLYYPNSVLATKAISNYNRSPEMMKDVIEFTLDFSTSLGSLDILKDKIKGYLESKPQHWRPQHSVQVKDIPEINKMVIALFVTHTMNFQDPEERGVRRSDLVIQLQKFREEMSNANLLPNQ